jgi:hypothetical protein
MRTDRRHYVFLQRISFKGHIRKHVSKISKRNVKITRNRSHYKFEMFHYYKETGPKHIYKQYRMNRHRHISLVLRQSGINPNIITKEWLAFQGLYFTLHIIYLNLHFSRKFISKLYNHICINLRKTLRWISGKGRWIWESDVDGTGSGRWDCWGICQLHFLMAWLLDHHIFQRCQYHFWSELNYIYLTFRRKTGAWIQISQSV